MEPIYVTHFVAQEFKAEVLKDQRTCRILDYEDGLFPKDHQG